MKAVIMAGGEGSRLRPITCDTPKPMARLCGRPVIEYILDLLSTHGFSEAAITVRYLPQQIIRHLGDRYGDIELSYVEEEVPLGTAGGVKNACHPEDEDLLVISGDAMCDFDLAEAIRFHQKSGSDATIIVKRVLDPREYGLVVVDKDLRVTGFLEKPAFSQAVSDLANTGVYILSKRSIDLIPSGQTYDFAQNLFPLMLNKGMKLYAFEDSGYWCDIGDLASYLRCQQDMLKGQVRCHIHGTADKEGNIFADGRPRGQYTLISPVYLGEGVSIGDNAVIEGSIIEHGCVLLPDSQVSRSTMLSGSYLGAGASMSGAVACAGASIKRGAVLLEGSAVGAGSVIGEHARIAGGIRIWPDKMVEPSSIVRDHVVSGSFAQPSFDDNGLTGEVGIELTTELCTRIGAAAASQRGLTAIALAYAGDQASGAFASAVSSGIRAAGGDVIDFGHSFEALFGFGISHCKLELGIFVDASLGAIKFACGGGLPLPRYTERAIEGAIFRGDYRRRSQTEFGHSYNLEGISALYENYLVSLAGNLSKLKAQVKSDNKEIENILERVLKRAGCAIGELTLQITPDGGELSISQSYHSISSAHVRLLCCAAEFEQGMDAALCFGSSYAAEEMAEQFKRRVYRYYLCPADQSDKEGRELAAKQGWSYDGLIAAIRILRMIRDTEEDLWELADAIPGYAQTVRTIQVKGNPASLIKRLACADIREGALVTDNRGVVLVKPTKRGNAIRLIAEAVSAEVAEELCEEVEHLLR